MEGGGHGRGWLAQAEGTAWQQQVAATAVGRGGGSNAGRRLGWAAPHAPTPGKSTPICGGPATEAFAACMHVWLREPHAVHASSQGEADAAAGPAEAAAGSCCARRRIRQSASCAPPGRRVAPQRVTRRGVDCVVVVEVAHDAKAAQVVCEPSRELEAEAPREMAQLLLGYDGTRGVGQRKAVRLPAHSMFLDAWRHPSLLVPQCLCSHAGGNGVRCKARRPARAGFCAWQRQAHKAGGGGHRATSRDPGTIARVLEQQ